MIHPYQILVPLLSLFWVRVDLTDLFPLKIPVQIVDIMDGDTLTVRSGNRTMKVRLSKIDAPEISQNFHHSRASGGKFSRICLKKLISKEMVLSINGFDQYRRILGDVGELNYKAVQHGCAGLYPHTTYSSVQEKIRFLEALNEAKKRRRGVWGHGGYLVPKKWRKINKRGGHQRSRR